MRMEERDAGRSTKMPAWSREDGDNLPAHDTQPGRNGGENPDADRERLAALATLAAGLAHEINNPLAVMLGFCEILMERLKPGTQEHSDLCMIWKHGLRCKKVIQGLLCFARETPAATGGCDINQVVGEALASARPLLEKKRIRTVLSLAEELPVVKGGNSDLRRSLLHLIENAQRIMEPGGTLTIASRAVPVRGCVEVRVSDDGPGMDSATLHRIYDPFFRAGNASEGAGLGLSICHGMIGKLGGTIECRSGTEDGAPPGRGTTFIISLPVQT